MVDGLAATSALTNVAKRGCLQAHHAVQWLARSARAYVPPQPDDAT